MTDRLWNFYSTVSLINALVSNCESKRDMRITPIIFVYIRSMLNSAGQTGVAADWACANMPNCKSCLNGPKWTSISGIEWLSPRLRKAIARLTEIDSGTEVAPCFGVTSTTNIFAIPHFVCRPKFATFYPCLEHHFVGIGAIRITLSLPK